MARDEQDREDLLAEAVALNPRAELLIPGFEHAIIVGFRSEGAVSCYFGADPAWHWNTRGELRRAYVAGRLFKAEHCRLVALVRVRTGRETQLVRQELGSDEAAQLLDGLRRALDAVQEQLAAGGVRVLRQVPPDVDVLQAMRKWLAALPRTLRIAATPRVR